MKTDKEHILDDLCQSDWDNFMQEIETDENREYRRGFRAGALFSSLRVRRLMSDYLEGHEHE